MALTTTIFSTSWALSVVVGRAIGQRILTMPQVIADNGLTSAVAAALIVGIVSGDRWGFYI